jgi:hypothetical protein
MEKIKKTENIVEYKKNYYQANKEHLNQIMLADVTCECGAISHRCNLPRHMKTKLHAKRLKLKMEATTQEIADPEKL